MDVSNDPEVERLGANATALYALDFWNKLCEAARLDGKRLDPMWENESNDDNDNDNNDNNDNGSKRQTNGDKYTDAHFTTKIILTNSAQNDDLLYKRMRSNFGGIPFDKVSASSGILQGDRWASLLMASEGAIQDFNFMTLLRQDAMDMFWMDELDVCDGLVVVPRSQFVFVELARIKEAVYDSKFRNKLQLWDTKTQAENLQRALEGQLEQESLRAITMLKTQWPHPRQAILKTTGVIKVLQKGYKSNQFSSTVKEACKELLTYWQDFFELAKISKSNIIMTSRRSRGALQRAGRALFDPSLSSLSQNHARNSRPFAVPIRTTSNLDDLIPPNNEQASKLFASHGMIVVKNYLNSDTVKQCLDQATSAFEALVKEQLQPRGLVIDGENTFDFKEVRQRPGHRVDNRYKILNDPKSPIAQLSSRLTEQLPTMLNSKQEDDVQYKLLYGGIVHSFPRKHEEDDFPDPQIWHRDGPSLFASAHHDAHCLNVFIPLINVNQINGTTEFIPGSHDDDVFQEVVQGVLQLANTDSSAQHELAVRPELDAGSMIVFDVRVLHRGLANKSMQDRPLLYFTFSRTWFLEEHMFADDEKSIIKQPGGEEDVNRELMNRLYELVAGGPPPQGLKYGHPHYTTRFDLLLQELDNEDKKTKIMAAILAFCSRKDKEEIVQSFIDTLNQSHGEKHRVLEEARRKRKRALELEAEVYLHYKDLAEEDDFASITTDMSDVATLYALTARLLFQDSSLCSLGFPKDEDGVCIFLAMLKACASPSMQRALEEAFTDWWHAGQDRFALIPKQDGTSKKVIVAFSSLGSGIARPEWIGSLKKNAYGQVDVLHVLDPAFSWYCQDPSCEWEGITWYQQELEKRLQPYDKVMFLGDSMGAAAALCFCTLADNVLAFTPQVDISNYQAITRADFDQDKRNKFRANVIDSVKANRAEITIHYGSKCDEDVNQVALLPEGDNLKLVTHDFDDHILSLHLKEMDELAPIVDQHITKFLC